MDYVLQKKLLKGLQTEEQLSSYPYQVPVLETSEVPYFTRCKVPSTGGGVGVFTIGMPQPMEHWASRLNNQTPHLEYLYGLKTPFNFECHTSPKKLIKFSPLNFPFLKGKDLLDSFPSRVFSKFPAFTPLISYNLSHTCPQCKHKGISRLNSRARNFGKKNIFQTFKTIKTFVIIDCPETGMRKAS